MTVEFTELQFVKMGAAMGDLLSALAQSVGRPGDKSFLARHDVILERLAEEEQSADMTHEFVRNMLRETCRFIIEELDRHEAVAGN